MDTLWPLRRWSGYRRAPFQPLPAPQGADARFQLELVATAGQAAPQHGDEGRTGPMRPASRLALYEERLVRLWDILVTTLDIHTVRVLLDRAVWQTAQRHPDIALLQHDDSGLSFEALEQSYATQPQEEIEAAFNDLFTELLLILTRLLDRKTAQCLSADLAVKDVPRRSPGQGPSKKEDVRRTREDTP